MIILWYTSYMQNPSHCGPVHVRIHEKCELALVINTVTRVHYNYTD